MEYAEINLDLLGRKKRAVSQKIIRNQWRNDKMAINFELLAKKFENEYKKQDFAIEYIDNSGNDAKEKSPYFTSISQVLQRRGHLLKKELISICYEKTKRQKNNYEANSEDKIKEITRDVIRLHPKTGEQIERLTQLNGVGVPVASAILTVIFPEYYCIIDYRAWRVLYWTMGKSLKFMNYSDYSDFLDDFRNYGTLKSYIDYLNNIRNLATQHNMSPRQIEMALYIFDKKKGIIRK